MNCGFGHLGILGIDQLKEKDVLEGENKHTVAEL